MPAGNAADTLEDVIRCVQRYVNDGMCASSITRDCELDKDVPWRPTLSGKLRSYRRLAVEVSTESVFPEIIKVAHRDIVKAPFLLDVYAACPEELIEGSAGYKGQRDLQRSGIGLLVVQNDGTVFRQHGTIPLVQQIPSQQVSQQIRGLPKSLRARALLAYDAYNTEPVNGLKDLSELIETVIFSVARRLYKNGRIAANPDLNDLGKVLNQIQSGGTVPNAVKQAVPALDDFRGRCRNVVSHSPRSYTKAQERAERAKRNFESGLDLLFDFYSTCRAQGVKFTIP